MLGHFENSFFSPLIKGFVSVSVASVLGWDQILHDGGRGVSFLDGRAPCGSPGVPPVLTGSELCRRVEGGVAGHALGWHCHPMSSQVRRCLETRAWLSQGSELAGQ